MRNSERNKRFCIFFLVISLFAGSLFAFIRISFVPGQLDHNDLKRLELPRQVLGSIKANDGSILYQGGDPYCDATLGNLIGKNQFEFKNCLIHHYSNDLTFHSFNYFTGIQNTDPAKMRGNIMHTSLLSAEAQEKLAAAMNGFNGCVVALNYQNGDVYTAMSLPSASTNISQPAPDGALINKSLHELQAPAYTPGSIMKIITDICAIDQNADLQNLTYHCDGTYTDANGKEINCYYPHGDVDMCSGTGKSCNGFFAYLVSQLDKDKALKTLDKLGFTTFSAQEEKEYRFDPIDRLKWVHGNVPAESLDENPWGMIGQGDTKVSPIHMALIAGAIANEGKTSMPTIVRSFENPNTDREKDCKAPKKVELMQKKTASQIKELWMDSTDHYYRKGRHPLSSSITCAKSGTAEYEAGGQNHRNRSLLGFMEEQQTAFVIFVENVPEKDPTIYQVANTLSDILAASSSSEAPNT